MDPTAKMGSVARAMRIAGYTDTEMKTQFKRIISGDILGIIQDAALAAALTCVMIIRTAVLMRGPAGLLCFLTAAAFLPRTVMNVIIMLRSVRASLAIR